MAARPNSEQRSRPWGRSRRWPTWSSTIGSASHTAGADFADPPFPDNRAAIARDDESGVGTGNPDTGDRHPAGRDLDHTNPDVRAAIKNYLRRLKAVGFQGWRYDLVKGYHGRFVGEYNDATAPEFSVGEFFDGDRQKVTDWIDATGGKSTAFDFPTRFLLFEACTDATIIAVSARSAAAGWCRAACSASGRAGP